jgi:hypothetical protein
MNGLWRVGKGLWRIMLMKTPEFLHIPESRLVFRGIHQGCGYHHQGLDIKAYEWFWMVYERS